jgi:hypothetical protein
LPHGTLDGYAGHEALRVARSLEAARALQCGTV